MTIQTVIKWTGLPGGFISNYSSIGSKRFCVGRMEISKDMQEYISLKSTYNISIHSTRSNQINASNTLKSMRDACHG